MILTINYIIDRFKEFATNHGNINDFVFGEFQDSQDRNYPLLNVKLEAPSYIVQGDRSLTPQVSFTFRIIDRIITIDNEENGYRSTNESEIYSDNYQYMVDLTQYVMSNLSPQLGLMVRQEDLITIDPIQQVNEDDVCGWESDMLFTTKYLNCDIPGISSGSTPANMNTITNSYITCATLPTCQTIIDIEDDITNLGRYVIETKTTDYTLSPTDHGKLIRSDSSSDLIFTIDGDNDFENIGDYVEFNRRGTGELLIDGINGVILLSTPGDRLNSQFSQAKLIKTSSLEYTLVGDLKV